MDCALWLNRQKVYSADEISANPDVASLRGYFLAGSLVEWLNAHNGEQYAKKLSKLRPDDPELTEKLAKIFGGSPAQCKRFGSETASANAAPLSAGSFPHALTSALGSFEIGSSGSFRYENLSSFGSFMHIWELFLGGSFSQSSFSFGSGFHEWEWEWLFKLYKYGSFTLGSFTSFHEWEWEWLYKAFRYGSFGFFGSFGSFSFGSFTKYGSLTLSEYPDPSALDEYDRIMLETLMRCPLDRFGYGIHNI